jgi:hypothetical protein
MAECGECSLCCKVMAVHSIAKPAGRWCEHCVPGSGCSIYAARPQDCRDFRCYWLLVDGPPELRPDRVHMVIADVDRAKRAFLIHVDPAYPRAFLEGKGKQMLDRLVRHQPEIANVALTIGDKHVFLRRASAKIA